MKKLTSVLLALLLVLAMVPMAASAEEAEGNNQQTTYAVKIGEKQYETLAAALEEAKDGDTLTLLKDIVLDATGVGNNQGVLTLTKDITLDGDTHTISGENFTAQEGSSSNVASLVNVESGAVVTLKDVTFDAKGGKHGLNIYSVPDADEEATTVVTLENVTVKNGLGYGVVVNNSTLNVTGLTTSGNGWGGLNVDKGSNVTIHDATLEEAASVVYENPAVEEGDAGSLTIEKGTFQNVLIQAEEANDTVGGSVSLKGGTYVGVATKGLGTIEAEKVVSVTGGTFEKTTDEEAGENTSYVGIAELIPEDADVVLNPDGSVGAPVEEDEHGTVTVDPEDAKEGDTVTITATPDKGYKVGTVSVTQKDGTAVAVSEKDGKYTFTQPAGEVTIEVTFVPSTPFTDVGDAWYLEAVEYVYDNAIMAGMSDTTFEPETSLTRAQAVQLFYNLEGKPDLSEENLGYPYADVTPNAWYNDAVYWARLTGVSVGMGENIFAPEENVSREQFAQMLYNYAKYKELDLSKTGDLTKFSDAGSISPWATTALSWANGNGLINGHEDTGKIDAQGTTTRAQAASILMNFDKNLVKAE